MSNSSYEIEDYSESIQRRPYRRINQDQRNALIKFVFQEKISISKASKIVGVNNSTAKVVIRNYRKEVNIKRGKQNKETTVENTPCSMEHNIHCSNNIPPHMNLVYFYLPPYAQMWHNPLQQTYPEQFVLMPYSPLE